VRRQLNNASRSWTIGRGGVLGSSWSAALELASPQYNKNKTQRQERDAVRDGEGERGGGFGPFRLQRASVPAKSVEKHGGDGREHGHSMEYD